MFYTGVSEETGELYTRMSDECVQLGKVISEKTGADMAQVGAVFFGFCSLYQKLKPVTSTLPRLHKAVK